MAARYVLFKVLSVKSKGFVTRFLVSAAVYDLRVSGSSQGIGRSSHIVDFLSISILRLLFRIQATRLSISLSSKRC